MNLAAWRSFALLCAFLVLILGTALGAIAYQLATAESPIVLEGCKVVPRPSADHPRKPQ